ncbi:MAG TPA: CoA-binding protein [Salinisphaeraceae bacterium]|nr:CoA-binding protein [Salinisphaeraceae bacterium]
MRLTEDSEIRGLLGRTRRIAIIGLSSNPERPSHEVAKALQSFGYLIVPVNPNETRVLGEKAFDHLSLVTGAVDMVDVFRRPEFVPEIVNTCIEKRIAALWLQEGVINENAANRAAAAGIDVVMNRCMLREYRRLLT